MSPRSSTRGHGETSDDVVGCEVGPLGRLAFVLREISRWRRRRHSAGADGERSAR